MESAYPYLTRSAGSTCSSMLGIERLFGVKKGMNPVESLSLSEEARFAVNPIDYRPLFSKNRSGGQWAKGSLLLSYVV